MERDREEAMKRKSKYTEEEIEMVRNPPSLPFLSSALSLSKYANPSEPSLLCEMQMQKSGLRGDVIMNMIKASKSSRDKDKDKEKSK
jgi:hypothetical protein